MSKSYVDTKNNENEVHSSLSLSLCSFVSSDFDTSSLVIRQIHRDLTLEFPKWERQWERRWVEKLRADDKRVFLTHTVSETVWYRVLHVSFLPKRDFENPYYYNTIKGIRSQNSNHHPLSKNWFQIFTNIKSKKMEKKTIKKCSGVGCEKENANLRCVRIL